MKNNISSFLIALAGFLFLVCGSVVLTLNLREIYYRDVRSLQIGKDLDMSEEEIRENYDALIDYNLITKGKKTLDFPSFSMSEHGRIHFKEVKQIFVVIQYLFVIIGVPFLAGLIWKIRKREYRCLKWMSVMTFVIPAVLGLMIELCWDDFFLLFHKLFFNNDYWLFDPVTDPVILILPDTFFAHCAVTIILMVVLGGLVSMAFYIWLTRQEFGKPIRRAHNRNSKNRNTMRR